MAPAKVKSGEFSLDDALNSITNGTQKSRSGGLDDLIFLLDTKKGKVANLSTLFDKHYHQIFEALFKCALSEKQNYLGGKKVTVAAASSRLSKCAEALRLACANGASKLKRKTILALIDHVTESLPGPDDNLIQPLVKDYVKAVAAILAYQPNCEQLAILGSKGWLVCVDFCVEVLSRYVENVERDSGSTSRASPAPGNVSTLSLNYSAGKSGSGPNHQKSHGQVNRTTLQDLLQCLNYLVTAANAPVQERSKVISGVVIQVLQIRHLSLSPTQQLAFATLNAVLESIQADSIDQTRTLAIDLVPLMSHWWQGRSVSKDEMLKSVRDEMLKTVFAIHLYLENLSQIGPDESLHKDVEDLLEVLWFEYARRDERAQLQLDDLAFASSALPPDYFVIDAFGLRPHNLEGERQWALIQSLALLEAVLHRGANRGRPISAEGEGQARKKRRTTADVSRLRQKLKSFDPGTQRTALQIVPFLAHARVLALTEVSDLLPELVTLTSDKNSISASWAMLACASCALLRGAKAESLASTWKHVWSVASRSVSMPGTSRAASVLLRTILEANLLPHHDISDDINSIVTTADVNGPALLTDSSLLLMFRLFHLRNAKLPSASQATCHHIIRWIFLRWNPAESTFAAVHSVHARPLELVNLIRACCGIGLFPSTGREAVSGSSISQAWKAGCEAAPIIRYLLLLDDNEVKRTARTAAPSQTLEAGSLAQTADPDSFYASKKLVLELFFPKLEELRELRNSWTKRSIDVGQQMSPERFLSLFSSCITGAILIPLLADMNSRQSRDIEPTLFKLVDEALAIVNEAPDNDTFFDLILRSLRIYMPEISTSDQTILLNDNIHLLRLFAKVAEAMHNRTTRHASGQRQDSMDLDDDFDSQTSKSSSVGRAVGIPRHKTTMTLHSGAFILDATFRLYLLEAIHNDTGQVGIAPSVFLNQILDLTSEELLCCQALLHDICQSDLVINPDDAVGIVKKVGGIIEEVEFTTSEVALCTCLDTIEGLAKIWSDEKLKVAELVGDLYNHLIKTALPKNMLSPQVQISLSQLLFCLLRVDPKYGDNLGLSSCRTTLLSIMSNGPMCVKYFIAREIADIFGLYVLMMHDEVFVDVLDSLPTDPESLEGIAFRLFVLAELACRWPTLLRRCTYHIFETPGIIKRSTRYATKCLVKVSKALRLSSPRDLLGLFAPQLLYTWLEEHAVDDIPFEIFGFPTLSDLLRTAQAEAAGIMVMRGNEDDLILLAKKLATTSEELTKRNFAKIMAYTIAHGIQTSRLENEKGEGRVKKLVGKEYVNTIYANFVDIIAMFFDLIDQEDPIEKYFAKDENLAYAASIMLEIKKIAHSSVVLPPNQQPMFKSKYLIRQLFQICSRTEYELHALWTPALVVFVARKLLNTVHPALGSLHACSVLRKVRVLICLAGPVVLDGHPLEMLLHSIRSFIVDSECADDALGISQYLISRGAEYLAQTPSFLAGYALSTLASLRVFLESSQSSTTQESQFKETMSKAQKFHSWFSKYLAEYESPAFKDDASRKNAFKSITESASHIRTFGNAEKGTHESNLLLEILKDEEREERLLDDSSRDLALGMLCGDFKVPVSSRLDIIETDDEAVQYSAKVWNSCQAHALSDEYMAWAGRVVGRSFAASGEMQAEFLQETNLAHYAKIAPGSNSSEQGIVHLLQALAMDAESSKAGLAEAALRTVVSDAVAHSDEIVLEACQKRMPESLYLASQWAQYQTPISDNPAPLQAAVEAHVYAREHIESPTWIQDLAMFLTRTVPDYIVLKILQPILTHVRGFAKQAFPFIVHLVLLSQLDQQQTIKRCLSDAMKEWLSVHTATSGENLELLVNTILYLRTQTYPNETSIADRANWLDVELSQAAAAASWCGMYKTALLFTELASSETLRSSRRSSTVRETDSSDVLLTIFENIDDPDAYYGLPQMSSLSNVLARLEYEKDGTKSLAFRGAQYDSHIRRRDPVSEADGQSLVRALSTLGLSGLSHSLLRTQQSYGGSSTSLESTFSTARRLEIWNLPAPVSSTNHSVTVYKAYQIIYQAAEASTIRTAINDGFRHTMRALTNERLNSSSLRCQLGALAVLTELDDILNVSNAEELEAVLQIFETRSQWMRSGRYDDVSQILSCRETTLSVLSQLPALRSVANLKAADARQIEIKALLMASGIYRFHQATQESLNISTSLTDLIAPCEELGLSVDAAVRMEAANSLWDHGEMISSIRMLQSIDRDSALKKQTLPVSRSDLLSKIGQQVSFARLEKPHDIQKKYLEPALKELRGESEGRGAGNVFHQFAMFCDQQLQSPDGLEDLARLQSLKKGKSDEVVQLKDLISSTRDSQLKHKYSTHLTRAKQWLDLDEQELRRVEHTRNEFVRLSLENYLLSLIASDEHNNDSLRFTALWLERSGENSTNEAVKRHLDSVPTRKFAPLMNQLSSRLQEQPTLFQKLLMNLVYRICVEHPYHGMYQIWSGTKSRVNQKDEVAVLRNKAAEKVAKLLSSNQSVASIWTAIDKTSKYYHLLAVDKDGKYKAGYKIAINTSSAGQNLMNGLAKYHIPPPTMQLELAADGDYSRVPIITKLEPAMSIASGVSAPKIITAVGSNGVRYRQLVKGGNDDLRQDAIMEQVFAAVSSLLKLHRASQQRNLRVRTYKVLPLTASSGLIEFVSNTVPLHEFLMPAHERYHPKDLKGSQCRKEISAVQNKTVETRISAYRKVTERFHPVMRYFFIENFADPDEWFAKRLAYTRTTAAISMLGHVLGLGDRHGHNILLDSKTGEVVHIDLGVAFETGRVLPVPELVPFRLTRDIVDGMGITKTEGVFRRCCEFTLDALREEQYSIMTILDVLRYDPLYSWSISPVRVAKLQGARRDGDGEEGGDPQSEAKGKKDGLVNEPSEADRALEVVRKKLSKTLSVTATVNDLINQASDERNLAVLYSGWAAYA